MKKTFKVITLVLALVFVLGICAFAEDFEKDISILVVGNSITSHDPNDHWEGNWGMAASSPETDYFGVMKTMFAEEFPDWNATWTKAGIYAVEKAIDANANKDFVPYFDMAFGNTMKKVVPDVVTFQFGDNVSGYSRKAYEAMYRQLADYCREINPDMTIVFSIPFYGNRSDPRGKATVDIAKEKSVCYTSLCELYLVVNTARGEDFYTDEVILSHPGDKGMAEIAKKFYPFVRYTAIAMEKNAAKETKDVDIWVDDKYIEMDVVPTIVDGRTLVPVRAIFEALGASVEWNQETKTATAVLDKTTVSLTLDSDVMIKTEETTPGSPKTTEVKLDVPAKIIDGRTLVPVRAISEAFGCQVNWLGTYREVQIWSKP